MKCQNDQSNDCGNRNTDPQVLVSLRSKSSYPEIGEEEIVRQDRNGQDVEKLPTKESGLCEARRADKSLVNLSFDSDSNSSNDN